jgi:hypothetical protein
LRYLPNDQQTQVTISGAVEGPTDEAVLSRLIGEVGCYRGPIYGKMGKPFLMTRVGGYNAAARFSPWVVLVDLDSSHSCAPELRNEWLASPAPRMCFRVVVRAVEAWLLADAERFCDFFHIPRRIIPSNVESIPRPKEAVVNLIRRSRRKQIRDDMVPRPGSARQVGPAYTSRIIEYVGNAATGWRPSIAARNSISLARCLACMRILAEREAAQ